MQITLQYLDGCPNWETIRRHLTTLFAEGLDASVVYERIDSYEAATEIGFRGSPTVLIDGIDSFADPGAPVSLACRVYFADSGLAGSPTIEQLREAIARAVGAN